MHEMMPVRRESGRCPGVRGEDQEEEARAGVIQLLLAVTCG